MLQQIFTLSFMTAFLAAAVRLAVPLMYGGIGETIAEKSGILNIGMEGVMLSGAFFSFAGAWYSGNLFVGLLAGMLGGLCCQSPSWSFIHYFGPESICFRPCDQHAHAWCNKFFI